MHEWGITESVVKEIIKQADENGLKKVNKVRLSLGEESGLTSDSLEFCFQCLAEGTVAQTATLEIEKGTGRGVTIDSLEGEKEDDLSKGE